MEIIGVIIAGIIIGLLGKFVAPGDKDNIPIWLTVLCGIGGVILGWFVYSAFGGNGSAGIKDSYRDRPVVQKPFAQSDLRQRLLSALQVGRSG